MLGLDLIFSFNFVSASIYLECQATGKQYPHNVHRHSFVVKKKLKWNQKNVYNFKKSCDFKLGHFILARVFRQWNHNLEAFQLYLTQFFFILFGILRTHMDFCPRCFTIAGQTAYIYNIQSGGNWRFWRNKALSASGKLKKVALLIRIFYFILFEYFIFKHIFH